MDSFRRIIHVDMDAFYASVEQLDNPELKGKPVAVGGTGRRGVISAASYEARVYGVRSAMPGFKAIDLCPDIIFVRPRFSRYKEISNQIRNIFYDYTDLVEPLSLDEAFLDVTENKKDLFSGTLIAKEIRKRIKEETGLTASAGVSFNKFLAKIASDQNKPDGLTVILPKDAQAFLDGLPIRKFFGIGKVTTEKMKRFGIFKGADLRKWDKIELAKQFGKAGIHFYHMVRAEDNRQVKPDRERKSVGAETTFREDLTTLQGMKDAISNISEELFGRLERLDNFGRTVTLKIKFADFQTITRSSSFAFEVRDQELLRNTALQLADENLQDGDKVRLLGLTLSNLTQKQMDGEQLELEFPEKEDE